MVSAAWFSIIFSEAEQYSFHLCLIALTPIPIIKFPDKGITFGMIHSRRQITLISLLALLLYFVPNLVQNIHRVSGHEESGSVNHALAGTQVHGYHAICAVCVFEFYAVDEVKKIIPVPVPGTESTLLAVKPEDQVQNIAFHYCHLRAPPGA